MTDLPLLLEAFRRNAHVNDFIIDSLTDAELNLSDGQGGDTILQLLSHMATSRGGWLLEHGMSPEHARTLKDAAGGRSLWTWQAPDRAALKAMFAASDAATVQAVQAHLNSGQPFADPHGKGTFSSSPAHFLLYVMLHDSHHRGQMTTLLRQKGRPREQLDALEEHWRIWRA